MCKELLSDMIFSQNILKKSQLPQIWVKCFGQCFGQFQSWWQKELNGLWSAAILPLLSTETPRMLSWCENSARKFGNSIRLLFTEAGHGKSPCDGVGGNTKTQFEAVALDLHGNKEVLAIHHATDVAKLLKEKTNLSYDITVHQQEQTDKIKQSIGKLISLVGALHTANWPILQSRIDQGKQEDRRGLWWYCWWLWLLKRYKVIPVSAWCHHHDVLSSGKQIIIL